MLPAHVNVSMEDMPDFDHVAEVCRNTCADAGVSAVYNTCYVEDFLSRTHAQPTCTAHCECHGTRSWP